MAVNGTNVALPPIKGEPYAEITLTSAITTLLLVCVRSINARPASYFRYVDYILNFLYSHLTTAEKCHENN